MKIKGWDDRQMYTPKRDGGGGALGCKLITPVNKVSMCPPPIKPKNLNSLNQWHVAYQNNRIEILSKNLKTVLENIDSVCCY